MIRTILFFLFCFVSLQANPLDPAVRSQINVHTCYSKIIDAYQKEKWDKLVWACQDLLKEFPKSPFARETLYYLGVAHFQLAQYASANDAFSNYLKEDLVPKFFEETFRYKFEIAKKFDEGARLPLFGWDKMPKWLSAYEEALNIYDEVITTLPRNDLTAQSLYRKGTLLLRMEEYKKSVETFQTLCRRFPKHPLTPKGYVAIGEVYLIESKKTFPDPDKLELAEMNLQRFKKHFPNEPQIQTVQAHLLEMKEILAKDLVKIAEFYERAKKKDAAEIYYTAVIKKYPETPSAKQAKQKLQALANKQVHPTHGAS